MKKLLVITAFTLASAGMAVAQSGTGNSANDSTDGTNAGQVGESTAAGAAAPPTATPSTTAPAGASATNASPAAAAAPAAAMSAQEFVNNAASGGLFEVQSSELAMQRSKTPAVKEFAQMMITDHTAANNELKAIAEAKGLKVPSAIAGPPAQHMAAVQAAEGDAFDKTYIQHQAKAHQDTIAMFQAEAQNGSDADLRAFAEKTLPTLNKHAEHVQAMMK
jgi:putative membrane protein